MIKNDEYFMKLALKEAKKAYDKGEIPVGAIVVDNNSHKILSKAHNLKESLNDVSAHAEILALKKASKKIKNWRLDNCSIYVTLEPCLMCASAILQSRIQRVIYSLDEPISGAFGGKTDITLISDNKITSTNGILKKESLELLNNFFKNKRNQ